MELYNPFRKDREETRPQPQPPISARDWTRLYVCGFVLVLVVGTMIYMKKIVDSAAKGKDRPGPGQVDFKVRDTSEEAIRGAKTAPESPQDEGRKPVQVPSPPREEHLNFRELAAPFHDGEEQIDKDSPEFLNLVNVFVNSVTREGLSRRIDPRLTAEAAYADPARHRGAALRVYGPLIQIYTERIVPTTPNNVGFVYMGIMQEYLTNRTVRFYMAEKPADPATGKPIEFHSYRKRGDEFITDWVEVDGIFLRRFDYPSQMEDENGRTLYARAAAMFVKSLRLASKPEISDPRGYFVFVVAGLGVLIAAIVVVAGVMSRKYGSGSIRDRMRQERRRREQAAGAAPPLEAGPKPGEGGSGHPPTPQVPGEQARETPPPAAPTD